MSLVFLRPGAAAAGVVEDFPGDLSNCQSVSGDREYITTSPSGVRNEDSVGTGVFVHSFIISLH
jgi:hypothetical protein